MSGLASLAAGVDVNGRKFATGSEGSVLQSMGFRPGVGPAATSFNIGWFNGGPWGGHTAGTVGGTNVEMGGGRGNGQVGGAAAGATNPQFTDHAWIPLGELVAFDYFRNLPAVSSRRLFPGPGGYSSSGGHGVGPGGLGVGTGGAGVTLHDKGGWHQPGTLAYNGLSEPEPILSPSTWRLVEKMIAVFPQATDTWVKAGQSLDKAAAQLTRVSETPAETAKSIRGLLEGKFDYKNIVGLTQGAPVVGTGVHAKDVLGKDFSDQLVKVADNAGMGAQAMGALNSEFMVNIAMSDQTIQAYEDLEKARERNEKAVDDVREAEEKLQAAREKAADSVGDNDKAIRDAEEKLAEAKADQAKAKPEDAEKSAKKVREAEEKLAETREKGADKSVDAQQDVVDAEENLRKAQANQAAAAAAMVSAEFGLQVAAVMGALELLGEVSGRISDAVVGGFEGAASRAEILSDSIKRLGENLEETAKIADNQAEAQGNAVDAAARLQQAVEAQREAERKARTESQQGIRDTQAAEFELRMTRWEAAKVAGASEVDLRNIREQAIFDVFATSTEADRKAIKSASDVLVAEARLANIRAQMDKQDFANTLEVAKSSSELELAQAMAQLEMDKLTSASYALAKAQAVASGSLGGATALEKYIEGAQKVAESQAKTAAGISTSIGAWLNPGRWFKGDTMKGVGMKDEAKLDAMEGEAMMAAYKEMMEGDLERLNEKDRAAAEKAIAELTNAATAMKMGGAAAYSVITGDGGAAVKVTAEIAMRKATAELDALMMKAKYEMEAAALQNDRDNDSIDRKQRLLEIEQKQRELQASLDSWAKRDTLDELVALTEQQLAEHEQENKQLDTISGKLDEKTVSTLMSIGGSGWGGGTGAAPVTGGFGGASDYSIWQTMRMEKGWLDKEISRALVPVGDTLADAMAAAGDYPTGLPDTVVDGYYKGPVEGTSDALKDAARRNEAELEANTQAMRDLAAALRAQGDKPAVGTQYTGPVTVNSNRADEFVGKLAAASNRA